MDTFNMAQTNKTATTGNRFCDRIIDSKKQQSTYQPKSPDEWRQWWLKRYSFDLKKEQCLSDKQKRMYWAILEIYLINNPGNPRTIPVDRAIEFISDDTKKLSAPLTLFYTLTAPSPEHVEAIKGIIPHDNVIKVEPPPLPVISQSKAIEAKSHDPAILEHQLPLLEALRKELSVRNYSRRTIRNYHRVITDFLRWHGSMPTPEDAPRIMHYNLYLKEQSGFAPRTINLYSAAISFFYRTVIKTDNITEQVPRMKIGKPLPKVYSEQQIAQLIAATKNPKHRLVIMLAYGGGLRLEEVRLLRRGNIDFDKDCIRVSKGKGRKDRVIMLDEGIKKALITYINSKPGIDRLFINETNGMILSRRTIQQIFENGCKKAGLPKIGGIHTLRHSFATHLMEHGTDTRCVQELLGHASLKTTEIYTHVSTAMVRKIKSPISYITIS